MDWKGARVVIVGAGRQGVASAAYLAAHGARPIITDMRSADQLAAARERLQGSDVQWELGSHPASMLDGAQMLLLSGGVPSDLPLVAEAQIRGISISNDSQLFLEAAPCMTVGITGSAGKTTTTTLVGHMYQGMVGRGLRRAWVGGNIGNPLLSDVDQMTREDIAIMELSSFQLEWMTKSPFFAAILNIAPNHLDRHGTMSAYVAAKARILDNQDAASVAILNREDPATWALAERVRGRLWTFGRGELGDGQLGSFVRDGQIWLRGYHSERAVLPLSDIELIGEHNVVNVLAACAIASAAGADDDAIQAGVRGFRGAPHRLETVRTVNGVDWVNDSIATAPQRTEAGLRSFDKPVVLMLGGRDKGLPWAELAALAQDKARHVVLFGEAAEMLDGVFAQHAPALPRSRAANLAGAVKAAATVAQPGDVVLLSPGGTSFDEFVDFEERGERFRQLVKEL
jgi:UDP-N-acetylmuramoylalanine--D-glutamate ligase